MQGSRVTATHTAPTADDKFAEGTEHFKCSPCLHSHGTSALQRKPFDLLHPAIARQLTASERGQRFEHRIGKAPYVQNVLLRPRLHRRVRLEVDTRELRIRATHTKLLPLEHRGGAALHLRVDPRLVV